MYLPWKGFLLQLHSLGCLRVAFKVTKVNIKAITKEVTQVIGKGTKVAISGDIKARERAIRVAINGITLV